MKEHPLALSGPVRERWQANLRRTPGKAYWRSLEELARTPELVEQLQREFPDRASEWLGDSSRRSFLKLMGASLALAGLTACTRQPVERIVPYIKQPEELVPGMPQYYATAMELGGFATGLLVESHEGHPTKIEGNPDHPMSLGATTRFHQAALLDLYDPDRMQAVFRNKEISSWEVFFSEMTEAVQLQEKRAGAGLHILTETVTSPSLAAQLQRLSQYFPEARWHQYEPINRDGAHAGSRLVFGETLEAQHDFSKARIIVSLEADFLHTHPAALRYARAFSDRRRITREAADMNRLYVVESTPTVTGSMADHRLPLGSIKIEEFAQALAVRLGAAGGPARQPPAGVDPAWLDAVAGDLQANRGASVVIAGEHQTPLVHALTHRLNRVLGNTGTTVHYTVSAESEPVIQLDSIRELAEALERGGVDVLLILGGNPAFTAPVDLNLGALVSRSRFSAHLSTELNETSALCRWNIPQTHFLESWGDTRAFDGTISIIQPLILPLYGGKSPGEFLEAMLRTPARSDYELVRDHWAEQALWPEFEQGWRKSIHDGLIAGTALPEHEVRLRDFDLPLPRTVQSEILELGFRPDPSVWDGRFANNGWLQELPKPVSKLTWDNAALISPALARKHQLSNGAWISLEFQQRRLRLPVWITPGQAEHSIVLTLGYGRTRIGRVGAQAGFNTFVLRTTSACQFGLGAQITRMSGRYALVATQTHHLIDSEERQILREITLAQFLDRPLEIQQSVESPGATDTLYRPEEHEYEGQRWGLSIDLTSCLGCNACVIACQSENNIPVVGKDQVGRNREMHWLRVDTYFSGAETNPSITHQPVPCMHCENAPCEVVCPVGATLHDHEGLNAQVYNRCIGTRYCSNNCPYKVRRFNFFKYADDQTPSLKPMRNPNVTVRSRGVMEKCTYCVQRISAARIQAKKEDRPVRDGEIVTACQQVCPAQAIVFGDISDPSSRVTKLKASPLNYAMLGGLNTHPRTTYLARVRNPHPALSGASPAL
jgi:MoCo/4Fe-4S cofactor protein with predicted Tat translocation signal